MSRSVFKLFQNAERLLRNAPHLARQLHTTPPLDAIRSARVKVPAIIAAKAMADHQSVIGRKSTDILLPTHVLQKKSAEFIRLLQQEAETNPEARGFLKMIDDYKADKLQVVAIEHPIPPVKNTNARSIGGSRIGKVGDERVPPRLIEKMIIQEALGLDLLQMVLFACGHISLIRDELPTIFPIIVSDNQEYHLDGDAEIKDGKILNVVDSTALYAVEVPEGDKVKTIFISNEDILRNLDAETIAILQKKIFYTNRVSLVEGHPAELGSERVLYPAIYFDEGEPRFIDGANIMISDKIAGEDLVQAQDALKKLEEAIKKTEKEDGLAIVIKASGDMREIVIFRDEKTLHRRSNEEGSSASGTRQVVALVAEKLSRTFVESAHS